MANPNPLGSAVVLTALTLSLVSGMPLHAADALSGQELTGQDCAQLTDRAARLACFDQVFAEPEVIEPEVIEPVVEVVEEKEPAVALETKETKETKETEEIPDEMFSRRARVNFTSKVKTLRAEDQQRMIFLLENGEVWVQSSPRNLPFKEGDEVRVKSGLMGGYFMRTKKGVSTRVNRVR